VQDVQAKVFIINIDYVAHVGRFFNHFGIKLFILDELCLKLLAARLVHTELAGAAGIGVGVAQLQVRKFRDLAINIILRQIFLLRLCPPRLLPLLMHPLNNLLILYHPFHYHTPRPVIYDITLSISSAEMS
jgi:hypothetical protein